MRRTMLSILAGALALYVAAGLLLVLAQRSLLFLPDATRVPPAATGFPAREQVLDAPDGARIVVWRVAAAPGKATLLYFHGNAGNLALRASRFTALTARGFGLFAASYRGYGGSTGAPAQEAILADSLLAYDALAADGVAARDIVPFGESLGTAPAVWVAARREVGALVLQSPFTAISDVAQRLYPIYPARPLMRDPLPAIDWIGDVAAPVLAIHGRRDTVVPFDLGERLFAAVRAPKRFVAIADAGHNDLDRQTIAAHVADFLADRPR